MKDSQTMQLTRTVRSFGLVAACFVTTIVFAFFVAPTEATMGDVQRILYVHIPVAWCGLASCLAMGATAAMYLFSRRLGWDFWSQASAEVGWLCATLTLITGSAWAHEAWGTWWTWDPRLTASLILWLIYAGIILVRQGVDDPHRRARISGVLAIAGMSDLPLVIMATRWFRGVHPVSPDMDSQMRLVLLGTIACLTGMFAYLIVLRRRQMEQSEHVSQLEAQAWSTSAAR